MKSFVMMLSFFTRIPVKALDSIDEAAYKKGIKHLPVIGLMIGAATGAVSLLGAWIGSHLAAFLTLLVYLLLTGALHMDGLADTMDAFGARRDREKTLAILKDSHIGTFGAVALVMLMAGDMIALAGAGRAAWLFPLAGRTAALLIARCFGCARPGGLGQWFLDGVKTYHIIYAAGLFVAAAAAASVDYAQMAFDAIRFAVFTGAWVLAAVLILLIVQRFAKRIGGITGDIVGFSIEAAQLVFLVLYAAVQSALC
jgi:adenosylcobinamide-GDP ribazoletransferase